MHCQSFIFFAYAMSTVSSCAADHLRPMGLSCKWLSPLPPRTTCNRGSETVVVLGPSRWWAEPLTSAAWHCAFQHARELSKGFLLSGDDGCFGPSGFITKSHTRAGPCCGAETHHLVRRQSTETQNLRQDWV